MTDLSKIRRNGGRRLHQGAPPKRPLVSIVTVVFRAAHELPPLIESILAHRDEDTEFVVIDGGSDDGTVELLYRYEEKIDYWISEPDRGIYDAMNKGIAAATGEFVLHLNAGDRLLRIPRQELEQCRADQVDLAVFAVDWEGFGIHRPRQGLLWSRFTHVWHHQGSFYLRATHMGYDTQYPVHADFDLNQRMVIAGRSIRCFNVVVSEMGAGGVSSTDRTWNEQYRIIRKNFGLPYMCFAFLWLRAFPSLKQIAEHWKSLCHRGKVQH